MSSIVLHGREFTVSPLTLGDLRRLEPALLGAEQRVNRGFDSMLSLVPVIHASIGKLHPDLALQELEDMLELTSFADVLNRVLEISGLKRSSPEPTAASGESQPAAE